MVTTVASGSETETEKPRIGFFAQVARFVLIGGFCAILDFSVYQGLRALGMESAPWEDIARAISFIVGTTTAYFLNRKFTFSAGATGGAKQVGSFVLLYGVTFFVAVAVNRLMLQLLPVSEWESTIAWVISQGTATAINFVMLKTVVFREPKAASSN
ncbi:MAG: GtrA family protein [Pseudonocardiaceae bacterium]|nr:GtrA family protein [Pseudonocardiaceae bacterium]